MAAINSMLYEFQAGDIISDGVLGNWIFFMHKQRLMLYPHEKFHNGKLSEEKGGCSFIHDPKKWNLLQIKVVKRAGKLYHIMGGFV